MYCWMKEFVMKKQSCSQKGIERRNWILTEKNWFHTGPHHRYSPLKEIGSCDCWFVILVWNVDMKWFLTRKDDYRCGGERDKSVNKIVYKSKCYVTKQKRQAGLLHRSVQSRKKVAQCPQNIRRYQQWHQESIFQQWENTEMDAIPKEDKTTAEQRRILRFLRRHLFDHTFWERSQMLSTSMSSTVWYMLVGRRIYSLL